MLLSIRISVKNINIGKYPNRYGWKYQDCRQYIGQYAMAGSYKDQGLTTGRLGRLDEIHWLHEVPLAGKHR
jgi:hypothetical protein